jgi:hypothetical protein
MGEKRESKRKGTGRKKKNKKERDWKKRDWKKKQSYIFAGQRVLQTHRSHPRLAGSVG